ncbi:MAG: leucine-rich repeat domain-containing protein [Malacoplasma sp.]|nr:leucine-rich repeat domain-containing protein [Malacoplasma sp.]
MKKVKLISSLTILGALSGVGPVVATSCGNSGGDDKDNTKTATIKSLTWIDSDGNTIDPLQNITTILGIGVIKDGDILLKPKLFKSFSNNGSDSDLDVKNNVEVPDEDWKSISITPKRVGKMSLKLKLEIYNDESKQKTTTYKLECNVVIASNLITYKGNTYSLQDNIDPNLFCGSGTTLSGPFMLINGNTITDLDKSKITNLTLGSFSPSATSIDDYFLYDCTNLVNLVLPNDSNINQIGEHFLQNSSIESISLKAFGSVTSIGKYFLSGCEDLKTLDLSQLSKLTAFTEDFAFACKGLTSVTFPSNCKATTIEDGFFWTCKSLETVDLKGLTNVQTIGNEFFYSCEALKNINLSSLVNVNKIGDSFMSDCIALESINLSVISPVNGIGKNFLNGCKALERVDLFDTSPAKFSTNTDGFMYSIPSTCKLYALSDLVNAYKNGPVPWCLDTFKNRTYSRETTEFINTH